MTKPSIEEILGKDLYEQVKAKIGDYEIAIIGPDAAMVPKRRLDEVIAERNRYKEQVAERDAQFAALKETTQTNEVLQKQITELQTKNKQAAEEHEKRLQEERRAFAVEREIVQAGARNPKAVAALLDTSKVSFIDGTLYGLDTQLDQLKKSDPYLFGVELKGRAPEGTGTTPQAQENPWKRETWNLTKQGQILKTDPELAVKLKAEAGVK
jgi:hypothetical protein